MASGISLNPFEKPPDDVRPVFKKFQKLDISSLKSEENIIDFERGLTEDQARRITVARKLHPEGLDQAFRHLSERAGLSEDTPITETPVYEHSDAPGLLIIPSLLPHCIQKSLLSRLLHRDLLNPVHQTNVHKFWNVPYPSTSFFSLSPSNEPLFSPNDPARHNSLNITQFLTRKLRWMTLGGQYDWTAKKYPPEPPPEFPRDICALLYEIFPDLTPQAAIVNLYSPKDTLSMHRDVAEACSRGLASISIGCDGIFLLRLCDEDWDGEGPPKTLGLRLRSGDAVFMAGPSRFAWHGVPQIVPGTCPEWLRDWPAEAEAGEAAQSQSAAAADPYSHWRGWMSGKRINLNVRQMWDGA